MKIKDTVIYSFSLSSEAVVPASGQPLRPYPTMSVS